MNDGIATKIGRSTWIEKRVTQVTTEPDIEYLYLETQSTFTAAYVEEKLHEYFKDYRLPNSEWFDISLRTAREGLEKLVIANYQTIETAELIEDVQYLKRLSDYEKKHNVRL